MTSFEKIIKDILGYTDPDVAGVVERAISRKYDAKKLKGPNPARTQRGGPGGVQGLKKEI